MKLKEFDFPQYMKLTKKEEKKLEDSINDLFRWFFKGFFWFVSSPIMIYKFFKGSRKRK